MRNKISTKSIHFLAPPLVKLAEGFLPRDVKQSAVIPQNVVRLSVRLPVCTALDGFSVIPKCTFLNDPEQLFHVKFWLPCLCEIIFRALFTNKQRCCANRVAVSIYIAALCLSLQRECVTKGSSIVRLSCCSFAARCLLLVINTSLYCKVPSLAVTDYCCNVNVRLWAALP